MKISVLGAGSWGTALAIVLSNNGHDVTLWEYKKEYVKGLIKQHENKVFLPGISIPQEITITHTLEQASNDQHMIVIAIPTQFVRSVLKKMKKFSFKNTTFVSVAKGIEKETLVTVNHIISDELDIDESNIAVLSGPSHAEEVSRKIPTAVVAAIVSPGASPSLSPGVAPSSSLICAVAVAVVIVALLALERSAWKFSVISKISSFSATIVTVGV